jgi:N utilization substance protein A
MAPKKKSKKQTRSKKTSGKKLAPKKKATAKILAKKSAPARKKLAIKKPSGKSAGTSRKRIRGQNQDVEIVVYSPAGIGPRSAGQSGSLQGLSDIETANSESVDELIEEGNAFEAEAVKGVEDAPDPDESEVHTHEVPENDVPGEYDDQ